MLIDVSLPYASALVIVGVPRGSTWSLTLSDVPNVRDADAELPPSDRRHRLRPMHFPDSKARQSNAFANS